MASRIVNFATAVDDFIIDRVLQPGVNMAQWYLGLPLYTVARVCVVLGAGAGLIWLHRFDVFPSSDFFQDMLCLGIMVVAAGVQIQAHEARAPRRPMLAPAVRLTGLLWRTLWLLDLVAFPSQWPVEPHGELAANFLWTVLLVLPYWIICCRLPPPKIELQVGVFRPAMVTVR